MTDRNDPADDTAHIEAVRIPLVEEQLSVGRREIETGRVHVRTFTEEEQTSFTELLERDVFDVERVPMDIAVQTAPQSFEDEHGVYIVPIVEERLVVKKRLFVVEELRIRRKHTQSQVEVPVTRRIMRAEIDREGESNWADTQTVSTEGTDKHGN